MAWQALGQLVLSDAWQFTHLVETDYIRVRFASPTNTNGRGYICQADDTFNNRQIYQVERLHPKSEPEILYLP